MPSAKEPAGQSPAASVVRRARVAASVPLERTRAVTAESLRSAASHRIDDLAAMLTFYTLLTMIPLALFGITVTLLVLPAEAIEQGLHTLTGTMPRELAAVVIDHVSRMEATAAGGLVAAEIALAFGAAQRWISALRRGLNVVFARRESRSWWRIRIGSFAAALGVGLLIVVVLGASVVGSTLWYALVERTVETERSSWHVLRWVLHGALAVVTCSLLYWLLPDVRRPFRPVTVGAGAGVVLWLAATGAFAAYVDHFVSYQETYGVLGLLLAFLLWLWLSNLSLLFGAEIDRTLANRPRALSKSQTESLPSLPQRP